MKAHVDRSTCIGCGLCAATCPMVFIIDGEGKAEAMNEDIHSDIIPLAIEAKDACPVSCIIVK